MSAYNDVPAINSLYSEQAQLSRAIEILDDNGTVSYLTVSSTDQSTTTAMGAVGVTLGEPPVELLAAVRQACVLRYNAINGELTGLGITEAPPNLPTEARTASQQGDDQHGA